MPDSRGEGALEPEVTGTADGIVRVHRLKALKRRCWGFFEPLEVVFKHGGRRKLPAGGYDLGLALERLGVPVVSTEQEREAPASG